MRANPPQIMAALQFSLSSALATITRSRAVFPVSRLPLRSGGRRAASPA